jgi:hypothetical protein
VPGCNPSAIGAHEASGLGRFSISETVSHSSFLASRVAPEGSTGEVQIRLAHVHTSKDPSKTASGSDDPHHRVKGATVPGVNSEADEFPGSGVADRLDIAR